MHTHKDFLPNSICSQKPV